MKWKRKIYVTVFMLPLITASCGGGVDNPAPVSDAEDSRPGHSLEAAGGEQVLAEGTAAGDFYYMELDSRLTYGLYESYAINTEWLYVTDRVEPEDESDSDEPGCFSITRKRISDGYQETDYAVTSTEWMPLRNEPLLLADAEGNCYIYWKQYSDYRNFDKMDEAPDYRLEKYGTDGKLLWSTDLDPDELYGMGENLSQGTVTGDGRVILYSEGGGSSAFAFGADGGLEEVYTPQLMSLEGVAVGKDNCVYGYCITGEEPVFIELGGEGKRYVCPVTPLAVYSGYEEGLCLRTGEGMRSYLPESGETERLWGWEDEYIQIEENQVDRVFQDGGTYMLLCLELPWTGLNTKQVLTFSGIMPERSGEYPVRQTVTLAAEYLELNPFLRIVVHMYNRQNRKYRIEFVDGGSNTFDYEKKLIQRDGADLMEIGGIYTGNLARHGAFENLEPYFESSAAVSMGDILESVREAGTIGGKNVAVITSFQINTLRARGDFVMPKEWTVWKFLEMGEEGQMFSYQSPQKALDLCMGLKYGEHFVDYEERTCSFDGEEFRRILEACGRWKVYDDGSNVSYSQKKGDWLFDEQYVHNIRDIVPPELPIPDSYEYEGEDYLSTLVGYPGWEGGEYEFRANIMLAINSVSENKEGAWDFLEYLLSEEIQAMMAQISGSLPVRKDCFEKCLRDGYADPANSMPVRITEKEFERMLEMAESAIMDNWGSHSNPLWDIVTEEAEMYFAGDSTLDSAVQKIQARVQLYLDEL